MRRQILERGGPHKRLVVGEMSPGMLIRSRYGKTVCRVLCIVDGRAELVSAAGERRSLRSDDVEDYWYEVGEQDWERALNEFARRRRLRLERERADEAS